MSQGAGGFLSFLKKGLGFEQEGTFDNITAPTPVVMHPGESIFSAETVAALRSGYSPAGGRPGYEYGPETYGKGGGGGVNIYNIIKPGVNAELETYRMAEKGRAFAEMVDG
jgi:hypothetical protein